MVLRFGDSALGTLREAAAPEFVALAAERYRTEAQENERRDAGRYRLEEIADELSTLTQIDSARWLETIDAAVKRGELFLRNPRNLADNLPYAVPKILRSWYDQAHYEDVNAWLKAHSSWTTCDQVERYGP